MSRVKYLIDEQLPDWLREALWRLEPGILVSRVGDPDAPARQTSDADVLEWAEIHEFAVLTIDTNTLIDAANMRTLSGKNTFGVFIQRKGFSIGRVAVDLHRVWSVTEAAEWRNRIEYVPF